MFGACSSTQSTNTATANQPVNETKPTTESQPANQTASANQPVNETKPTTESQPANQTALAVSPTEVLKAFTEATKKKDIETIKKTLSKSMMRVVEETAKRQNISVDEMLKKIEAPTGELKNEKIEGDTATVEIKNEATSETDLMPFVKDDGSWKIALDVFMDNVMKKINEESKKP